MQINGSSAIITGGASGLGEATARKLAAEGVRVTVFDRNEERGKEVVAEIGAAGWDGSSIAMDPPTTWRRSSSSRISMSSGRSTS
jgi:NAD(P)-dependent dehydrogenase (short-subunit alcohol dehydrogenase family)